MKADDKHKIHEIARIILMPDSQHPVIRRSRNEITVGNFQFPPVRQIDRKRLEWNRFN